jgi:hypothetical protein
MKLCLVVAMGLFVIGCGADEEEEAPPPPPPVMHLASSLERKLATPIAIPTGTPIGASIEDLVAARAETLTAQPLAKLGPNGQRCTTVKYVDEKGVQQMRRDKCDKVSDRLIIGKLVYADENADGKVDQFSNGEAASYDLFDEDYDGKVDRLVESIEHIATPISLTDFGENVVITSGGKIATRAREDKDHDGKFDVESVTATTAFQISSP